jgi:uncharacterized protein (TIGR03118 family)
MAKRFGTRRSSRSITLVVAAASGLALAAPAAAFASTGHGATPRHGDSHGQAYGGAHGHGGRDHGGRGDDHGRGGDGRDHHGHGGAPAPHDVALQQTDLASNVPGLAKTTDPDLKNPWGISLSPTSPLWVSNQGTDSSTVYSLPAGSDAIAKSAAVRVTLPGSVAGPSGQVANTGKGFVLSNGTTSAPAQFIFATLDGHIEAWNGSVDGTLAPTEDKVTVTGAAYTGLAEATTRNGDRLFAADFSQGTVDVFDSSFKPVKTAPWQFHDARLPKGYLPFNTQTLDGHIFVTYDKTDATTGREAVGKGLGIVDEYDTDGRLVSRIASGGSLNAPWGLAIAPASWGKDAGSLLVGNFGDGRINIIAKGPHGHGYAGHVTGQVRNKATGKPFSEPGLWGLLPGTATAGGTDTLWFAAGIDNEQDGLLGVLRP